MGFNSGFKGLILTDPNRDFFKVSFYQLVTQSHDYLQI